jgi:predicted GNAT family acetyltransferase
MIESVVFGLALTGAVMSSEPNDKGREAGIYALRATYYQSGYDKVVEPYIKSLDKKYVPNSFRKFGIGASFVYRLIEDNRIEYSWSF